MKTHEKGIIVHGVNKKRTTPTITTNTNSMIYNNEFIEIFYLPINYSTFFHFSVLRSSCLIINFNYFLYAYVYLLIFYCYRTFGARSSSLNRMQNLAF
jgi:hypothetical protein